MQQQPHPMQSNAMNEDIACLLSPLENDLTDADVYFAAAKQQYAQSRLFPALETLAQSIRLEPTHEKWMCLGQWLQEASIRQAAEEAYAISSLFQQLNIELDEEQVVDTKPVRSVSCPPPPQAHVPQTTETKPSKRISWPWTLQNPHSTETSSSQMPKRKLFSFRHSKRPPKPQKPTKPVLFPAPTSPFVPILLSPLASSKASESSSCSLSSSQWNERPYPDLSTYQPSESMTCALCHVAFGREFHSDPSFSCLLCRRLVCHRDFLTHKSICIECNDDQDENYDHIAAHLIDESILEASASVLNFEANEDQRLSFQSFVSSEMLEPAFFLVSSMRSDVEEPELTQETNEKPRLLSKFLRRKSFFRLWQQQIVCSGS